MVFYRAHVILDIGAELLKELDDVLTRDVELLRELEHAFFGHSTTPMFFSPKSLGYSPGKLLIHHCHTGAG